MEVYLSPEREHYLCLGEGIGQGGHPEELSWMLGLEGCIGVCQTGKKRALQAEEQVLGPEYT